MKSANQTLARAKRRSVTTKHRTEFVPRRHEAGAAHAQDIKRRQMGEMSEDEEATARAKKPER